MPVPVPPNPPKRGRGRPKKQQQVVTGEPPPPRVLRNQKQPLTPAPQGQNTESPSSGTSSSTKAPIESPPKLPPSIELLDVGQPQPPAPSHHHQDQQTADPKIPSRTGTPHILPPPTNAPAAIDRLEPCTSTSRDVLIDGEEPGSISHPTAEGAAYHSEVKPGLGVEEILDTWESEALYPPDSPTSPSTPSDLQIRLQSLSSDQSAHLIKSVVTVVLPSQASQPPAQPKSKTPPSAPKSKRKPKPPLELREASEEKRASGSKATKPAESHRQEKGGPGVERKRVLPPVKPQESQKELLPSGSKVKQQGSQLAEQAQTQEPGQPDQDKLEVGYEQVLTDLQSLLYLLQHYYHVVDGVIKRKGTKPFTVSLQTLYVGFVTKVFAGNRQSQVRRGHEQDQQVLSHQRGLV